VTLEGSFDGLRRDLQQLRDAVASLRVTLVVDRPTDDDLALVDSISDVVDDVLGLLKVATTAAAQARQASEYPRDLPATTHALAASQAAFNGCFQKLLSGLMPYERIVEVITLGEERGGEWAGWADSVKDAIDRCREPADRVTEALLACWQETAERAETQAISIRTISIGQQIGKVEDAESSVIDAT
jgi:hypothetical protein